MTKPNKKQATDPLESLKALSSKLKSLRASFNNICQFVDQIKDDTSANQISVRLQRFDELFEMINDTMWEIEAHPEFEDSEELQAEKLDFENTYYDVRAILADSLKSFEGGNQSHVSDTSFVGPGSVEHVRLPQIKLQDFGGNIDEWLSFKDLFVSLIHEKQELPDVEKFYYLKGCLSGEAKAVIDQFDITKDNYSIAWNTLCKRFDNSKLLRRKQIQALFKLPALGRESAVELHKLVNGFERTVHILDQVVKPEEYKDLLLVELLSSRLDPSTRRGWEEHTSTQDKDVLKDMMDFLHRRMQMLESLPAKSETKREPSSPGKRKQFPAKLSHSAVQTSSNKCPSCSNNHGLSSCPSFLKMTTSSREAFLRSHSLCRNCLRGGHQAKACTSKFSCRVCKARHHTLVCFKEEGGGSNQPSSQGSNSSDGNNKQAETDNAAHTANVVTVGSASSNVAQFRSSKVLLATAVVLIEGSNGFRYPARALLDSGSECNFISENLCQLMKVQKERVDISIVGIGEAGTRVSHRIQATVSSRTSSYSREMNFLVLPSVTACLPTATVQISGWNIPPNIELADPEFFRSRKVDLVIGIQAFFNFFQTGREIPLGDGLPVLTESVFGWIVSGEVKTEKQTSRLKCNLAVSDNLKELMARFWSCEEVGAVNNYSPEEAHCEEQFGRTVQREPNGRYVTTLPKNEKVLDQLGESKDIALKRLQGVERRLARDSGLRQQYHDFMAEYLKLDHMKLVDNCESDVVKRCYLPHHPVIKESSTTTKVRVVFDASCKTSTGVALNDALYAGPVVQQELWAIVLRSRTRQVMVVADVEKMFRQIGINEADRPLQSILWRFGPEEEFKTYELATVTYGTKCAPFLATRTLKQLASDERERYPLAAQAIEEDVYMDDVISGADDVESALELRIQIDAMMRSGGFLLRKWASNNQAVLDGLPRENLALPSTDGVNWDQDAEVKTLGLTWLPNIDCFKLQSSVPPLISGQILTKRIVLSFIARLFDPLGLLGATIVTAKLFMQQLWCLKNEEGKKLQWDDQLPETVGEEWRRYHEQLPRLNELRIERCVVAPMAVSIEFHCFSDASTRAYGAVVYCRSVDSEGTVTVRLLTSKSKVAPLSVQTLPRLELCGAHLAAQLWDKVNKSLKMDSQVWFWTDSTCVLQWIKALPSSWNTFVANRVAKIQTLTEGHNWNHVPGITNPADLISRGVAPKDILQNSMWWTGPPWLKETSDKWPKLGDVVFEEAPERRVVANVTAQKPTFIDEYLAKFSSFTRLVRLTAYWLRFINRLRQPNSTTNQSGGFLTARELDEAELVIIRKVQAEIFLDEIKALSAGKSVSRNSKLRWFNPHLDGTGILRVGGRLAHSRESEGVKHPMVLPAKHAFTELILRHYHLKFLHAGPQLLLGSVRQRYWPLGGRNVARKIVHQCQRCFRVKPSIIKQQMGELPAARVTVAPPFSKTGVDYFGPVYLKAGRKQSPTKAYVAIFVCMATKAVHMELVSDLSTECFLQALRRFLFRRGGCTDIYSDNGTNFVGARNQITELFRLLKDKRHGEMVSRECVNEGINWHFNPPSAPHFGGLWEAAVRCAKFHLLRIIGGNPVSYEDYYTLLVQVEGCLNSRPLTALSDDPTDLCPLTPAHFLVGGPLRSIPDRDYTEVKLNRLNRWQLVQRQLQDFWKRWKLEYLSQMQARSKHWQPAVKMEVGKLVIIVDDNLPPLQWKMGRIQELHPGADGVTRVITVRTASGSFKRPVAKICILPMQDLDEAE